MCMLVDLVEISIRISRDSQCGIFSKLKILDYVNILDMFINIPYTFLYFHAHRYRS